MRAHGIQEWYALQMEPVTLPTGAVSETASSQIANGINDNSMNFERVWPFFASDLKIEDEKILKVSPSLLSAQRVTLMCAYCFYLSTPNVNNKSVSCA